MEKNIEESFAGQVGDLLYIHEASTSYLKSKMHNHCS